MDGVDPVGLRAVWDFLMYAGVAGAMLVLIVLLVRGRLVADVHHQWVIAALSKDRDEWKTHATSLGESLEELRDGLKAILDAQRSGGRR